MTSIGTDANGCCGPSRPPASQPAERHRLASVPVSQAPEGINETNVTAWMVDHVPGVNTPLTFTLIAGGRSNLTFRVEDALGRAWALRRPPLHHVLPTAHDMSREYRLMHSLGPAGIPVPVTVGLCSDEAVNERPFYVMEFVEGHILRSATEAEAAFDQATRRADRGPHGRHSGLAARRRSRRGRTGRPRPSRGLHRAAAQALARTVRADAGRGRRSRRRGRAGERRAGPAHPQAAADLGGARGLPHGQRRAGRRRVGAGHSRLGDLHPGRSSRRRGAPDGLLGRSDRLHGRARALPHDGAGVLHEGRGPGSLCLGLGSRPLRGRLLRRLRLLEAGLHPPGRVRPLRRRRGAGDQGSVESFPAQIGRLFEMAAESLESVR